MGIEGLIKMIETFDYDKRAGIDLPNEKISQTPKSWMPSVVKREGKWSDIRTVYASIGQDTVVVTPISMLRAVSSIGMQGKMYVPHLLKEFKAIGAIGEEGEPDYVPAQRELRLSTSGTENYRNDAGTKQSCSWKECGASSTAAEQAGESEFRVSTSPEKPERRRIRALGSDVGAKRPRLVCFISLRLTNPKLPFIALIENSGFGGSATPRLPSKAFMKLICRKIISCYRRTNNAEQQIKEMTVVKGRCVNSNQYTLYLILIYGCNNRKT